jgi:purine-nucleoside phosphorylase
MTNRTPARDRPGALHDRQMAGIKFLAVEMEAAALYCFARAMHARVLCLAHVTNTMGAAGDFEKGEADGTRDALAILESGVTGGLSCTS